MSSSTSDPTIAVLIRVPADLLARVDRLASDQERTRTWIMKRAATAFCDAIESSGLSNPAMAAAVPSSDAHAAASLSQPDAVVSLMASQPAAQCGDASRAAEAPGGVPLSDPVACPGSSAPEGSRASGVIDRGTAAAPYPLNIHLAGVRRMAALAKAREAEAAEHRDRVQRETIRAMKGIDE
jgi:hypothetical protein